MLSLRVILIIFHLILKLHFSSRLKQSNCEEYLSQEELKFLEDELIQKNKKNNNTELEVILSGNNLPFNIDCRNGVVFQVLNLIKDNAKNFDAVHCFCKPKDNPTIQLKCMRNGNFITGFELIKLEQKIRNKFKSITPHKCIRIL